jgi:anti-anti-sigma factor
MYRSWLAHFRRSGDCDTNPDSALRQVDPNLAIGVEHGQGWARVLLAGELDLGNTHAFAAQLRHEEESLPDLVEIDLRGLTFIDSSGLSELFAANRRARERNGRVVLITDHGPIERTLNLARVEDVIDVVEQPV